MKIADTRIVPDSGNMVIRRKARIETLKNAVLYTNDVSKYYKIYDAEIEVNTRHDYVASGTYDFVDENEQVQSIFFPSYNLTQRIKLLERLLLIKIKTLRLALSTIFMEKFTWHQPILT